ncbi:class I SAM-dependent methyltransferase [Leptothoe sp. PORK10 BA2]|uniref:class I SAM-dependent methyltransferase n=1 Tax=Leptothoe sp. PORK10 BA2 TaxID=3110254 RepID=UPI002B2159F2|nr:class I SAM-dependent methyltransferase [Leptothoe sp. PORK10 BA2]MEA5466508.1 class I SAM-dependent methyltransferase [Leptothoe sp. PORK10 BA2]
MKNFMSLKGNLRLMAAFPYRLILGTTGINVLNVGKSLRGLPAYLEDVIAYCSKHSSDQAFSLQFHNLHPCLSDRYSNAGVASGDYFHQDLWAARKIFAANPKEHWDIGSRLDGFIAHLLTFRSVNVIDIRTLESHIDGLTFHQGDVTALDIPDNSLESLSCLHAMEHIGLGRYGDPVDPMGYMKGILELQRVLAQGGTLYFSVPIGRERVEFNAQRVFDPATIIQAFSELELVDFSAVAESGEFVLSANWQNFSYERRACGLFVFKKSE